MNEYNAPPDFTPSAPPPPPRPNLTALWIILAIIITFLITSLVVGVGVFFWLGSRADSLKSDKQNDVVQPAARPSEQPGDNDDNDESGDNDDDDGDAVMTGFTVTSVDAVWDRYTNYDHGFSIKIPRQFYHYNGADCTWDGDSFRPAGGLVPTEVFESPDRIYISSRYFYHLAGETVQDFVHYYSQCDQVTNSVAVLQSNQYYEQQKWIFEWRDNVNNNADLEAFLRDRYGSGCSLGTQDPTDQPGVFDVKIQGDGLDLGSTLCPLNYATIVRYYPAEHKVVAWDLGQAITFAADSDWMNTYDQEMVDSFRFE